MFSQQSRFLLHNENTSHMGLRSSHAAPAHRNSSPAHSSPKPRMAGRGQAPSKRQSQASPGVHGVKPYTRSVSASITRAKEAANKPATTTTTAAAAGQGSTRVKHRPPPILIPGRDDAQLRASARDRAARAAAALMTANQPVSHAQRRVVSFPLKLPRPSFPPVQCRIPSLHGVPADYVMFRITPHLKSYIVTSALYRPMPHLNHPAGTPHRATTYKGEPCKTFAFGIPKFANGEEDDPMRARIAGREPDICLAVKGKDNKPAKLIPVNQLVYSARCGYWPTIDTETLVKEMDEDAEGESDDDEATIVPSRGGSVRLDTIHEEAPERERELGPDDSSSQRRPVRRTPPPPESTIPAAAWSPNYRAGDVLHLPLCEIVVPSPDTFVILHKHLHFPDRSMVAELLDVEHKPGPDGKIPNPGPTKAQMLDRLMGLSQKELLARCNRIHAVWRNITAMGLSLDRTWRDMGEAWAMLMGIMTMREAGVEGMDLTQ